MIRTTFAAILAIPLLITAHDSSDGWEQYPCPSGAIKASAAVVVPMVDGTSRVEVPGTIGCGVPAAGPTFAVAVFPQGAVAGPSPSYGRLFPYVVGQGPTTFRVWGGVQEESVVGLCLMTDDHTRLSCVRVAGDADQVSVTQLPVSDPLVQRPVEDFADCGGAPACGTCWWVVP